MLPENQQRPREASSAGCLCSGAETPIRARKRRKQTRDLSTPRTGLASESGRYAQDDKVEKAIADALSRPTDPAKSSTHSDFPTQQLQSTLT